MTLRRLLTTLADLDWDDRAGAHRQAQRALLALESPQAVLDALHEGATARVSRSVEKTTHFKWFVAADPAGRFELWLHDYKPAAQRRVGHAVVAHTHRFWFTSLILRGGFDSTLFARRADEPGCVRPESTFRVRAGDVFVSDPADIHSLSAIEEGTLSLLVQSAPIRNYSEVFEDGRVTRYYDLGAQYDKLLTATGSMDPFPADGRRAF